MRDAVALLDHPRRSRGRVIRAFAGEIGSTTTSRTKRCGMSTIRSSGTWGRRRC